MAILNRPDYKFGGEVPTAVIIQAYQQKAQAEDQARQQAAAAEEQKWVNVAKMVQSGADMVTKFTEQSKMKMQQDAFNAATALLRKKNQVNPETGITFGESPDYQSTMESYLAKADPAEYQKQKIKNMTDMTKPQELGRRYQQSQVQRPDATGQMHTYSVAFDQQTGQYLNPINMKPLVSEVDWEGLTERGYAQSTRPAGYTLDGKEIVEDVRTGNKYIVSVNDSGQQTKSPYNGTIYPKLENASQATQDAMTNLQVAGETLQSIKEKYKSDFVGPVASRYKTVTQYVESLTDEEQTAFKTELQSYQNYMIKAITGAQMSEPEAARLLRQMPDDKKSPRAFMTQLEVNDKLIQRQMSARLRATEEGRAVYGKPVSEERLRKLIDEKFKAMGSESSSKKTDLSSIPTDDLFKRLAGGK